VAVPGAAGPPYDAAIQLTAWALAHADYLEGRLLLAGIDTAALAAHQWLAVAYTVLADSIDGMVDRTKVLANLDAQLAKPALPDRETWGTDPTAVQGQRAMMELAGGPAPMRNPDAQRPEAWQRTRGGDPDSDGDR
jgi:hypothetical protein